ncbi:hypothetical protein NHX12_017612 [Muraenolepis orangiensis]|uniref:Uncharacterized protein n=1 Tax=Muraenolepis orangiensis TaxID=630683 RepID=A0A9Q0IXC0_9TELE|nr:hypothetical protein NHX12_017612 [Muraenolepis orangiensis]
MQFRQNDVTETPATELRVTGCDDSSRRANERVRIEAIEVLGPIRAPRREFQLVAEDKWYFGATLVCLRVNRKVVYGGLVRIPRSTKLPTNQPRLRLEL